MTVPFNVPCLIDREMEYIHDALMNRHLSGDGPFTRKCEAWLARRLGAKRVLLTHSGTAALEMAALLLDIQPGDEVIMPSFTFPSTATAFVLRGAKPVFIDIDPRTANMDASLVAGAITPRTKALVAVHYAGVMCDMDRILEIANHRGIPVVEDAAQAILTTYRGKAAGTVGAFGCLSFHETKNIQCGEGGALVINDSKALERAEILREKGTNRSRFFRGEIDKYGWVDIGSSYLPSELNAAYLFAQLENADVLLKERMAKWNYYNEALSPLESAGHLERPFVPDGVEHNAHLYHIKVESLEVRQRLITRLKGKGIHALFHYLPLHSSEAGLKWGRFHGPDRWTTQVSERLVRLPLFHSLSKYQQDTVVSAIAGFFAGKPKQRLPSQAPTC